MLKDLKDYILEWRDMLGHELKVGDWVEFQSGGIGLWGEIEEITDEEKQKYVIKTMGWFGDKSLRSKVKPSYRINVTSKSLFLVNKVKK